MKPLIGITVGEIRNALYNWAPIVYGQGYTYCEAIERAGGVPVLIPLMADTNNLKQLYETMDGILLAGGNDINPELYEEEPYKTTIDCSDKRDRAELLLTEWALRDKKPILGICRGMQLLNIACGGTLYQDILADIANATDHQDGMKKEDPTYLSHEIQIDSSSQLRQIIGKPTIQTNSLHHQAVKELGKNLRASAWSADGVIEAIESTGASYALGIQSHPESLEETKVPELRRLFASFTEAAAFRSNAPLLKT